MYRYTDKNKNITNADFIYPDFSYQVIGIVFEVEREMGFGYRENQYRKALMIAFEKEGLSCKEELPVKIMYKGEYVTTNYIDILIKKDDKRIVLEIKQGDYFGKNDIKQLYNYLSATGIKLGLLVRFARKGVKFKRVVNLY